MMPIRMATRDDIPALMALEKEAAGAAHWSQEHYERLFAGEGRARLVFVIGAPDRPQGFLVAGQIGTEWEVENVVVSINARRQGLASQLLGQFFAHARSQHAESAFLEVRDSNHAARGLYQKCKFVEVGRRWRYYQDPVEDAVLYRLSFV